jgi:ATP-dependent Lon protease
MRMQENKDKMKNNSVDSKKKSGKSKKDVKEKCGESSDSSESYSSEEEELELDSLEYKKFLNNLFPSKNLTKQIKDGEALKKLYAQTKKSKVSKTKKKSDESEEEVEEEEEEDEEEEPSKKRKTTKNKKSPSKSKKSLTEPSKSSKSKSKREVESESEEESDDSDSDNKKSNKFNIIFTIGGVDGEEDDDDEDWEDWDEEDEEEWSTEDEDEEVSSSDEDEYDSDEYDEESEAEESEEESVVHVRRSKRQANKRNQRVIDISDDEDNEVEESKSQNMKKSDSFSNKEFINELKTLYKKNKNNKDAKACVEACEKTIKEHEKKQKRKEKKHQEKNTRIFKRLVKDKNTNNDFEFFGKLEVEEQKKIIKELREINKVIRVEKPYRMTLLEADMPTIFKGAAMKKINSLRYMEPGSGEYYKIKNWVDTFMRIPFGKCNQLPLTIENGIEKCNDFMENAKNTLDNAVYGLEDAKMQIMQMMGQLITNPSAMGTAIAIQGPMGTGKTTLVKEGISKILNRPFAFIALGGATDSSFLEGHSYTYEGSTWGKIVQILVDSKCMNPVIYFDELDKISDTPKGEEIAGILTHLTDTSQNNQFHDKYFAEIDFDLSKCLFIFSYNDESKINPILKDRMYRIHTKGYEKKQKTIIANNYLLPKIREQVKFNEEDIIIPDDTLHYIMETYCKKEDGVRNMKRCLEIIYTKLNLYRLMKPDSTLFKDKMDLKIEFPVKVTNDLVNKLIIRDEEENMSYKAMYL